MALFRQPDYLGLLSLPHSKITAAHHRIAGTASEVRLIDNPHEADIVRLWQDLLHNKTDLATKGGRPIRVIYPGRSNDGQGADFQDAVIATSQGLVKGDIEVHVRSSDWRTHRHHLNPFYNRVVLHVVLRQDTQVPTQRQNGKIIPILELEKQLYDWPGQTASSLCPQPALNMPCAKYHDSSRIDIITEFLDSSGEKRFLAKAARFRTEIAQYGPSQCLYQRMMEALGYSQNKLPFFELARRLPVAILEPVFRHMTSNEEILARLQALLLGPPDCSCHSARIRTKKTGQMIDMLTSWKGYGHLSTAASQCLRMPGRCIGLDRPTFPFAV